MEIRELKRLIERLKQDNRLLSEHRDVLVGQLGQKQFDLAQKDIEIEELRAEISALEAQLKITVQ